MTSSKKRLKSDISEEIYRLISENTNDLIRVLDRKFKIQYINEGTHFRVLGYTKDELIGKSANAIIHSDEKKQVNKFLRDIIRKGESKREGRLKHKDGYWIWFDIQGKLFEDSKGNWNGLLISRNITEKKLMELQLKESEEKHRIITQNVNDLIFVINKKFVMEFVNEQESYNYLGYKSDELLGKNILDFVHPLDKERGLNALLTGLKKKEGLVEVRVKHKNGKYIWFEVKGKVFIDKKNELKGIIVGRDITERKKADQKIQYQAKLVEDVSDAIISTDMEFRIVSWNKAAEVIYGWRADEAIGINIEEIIPIEYPYDEREEVQEKFFEDGSWRGEVLQKHKDGRFINILTSVSLIKDIRGNPVGIVATNRDISERKKIQESLRESEEAYRSLTEGLSQTRIGIDIVDSNYNIIYQNQFLKDQFGKHENRKCFEFYLRRETYCEDCPMMKAIQNRKVEKAIITTPNNRTYEIISAPLPNPTGFIEKAAEVIIDITERIESEQKLKESEEKYRKFVEQSKDGVVLVDENATIIEWNKGQEKISGLKKKAVLGKRIWDVQYQAFPDELKSQERLEHLKLSIKQAFKTGNTPWDNVLQERDIRDSHGNRHIIQQAPFLIKTEKKYMLGVISRDITELKEEEQKRKFAQEELQKSYEKLKELEKIINSSPGVLFLWKNTKGWPVEFVSENIKQFGYNPEDFYSGKVYYEDIVHPDDLDRIAEEVNNYNNEDIDEFTQEYRIITKAGEVKWLDDRTWIRRDIKGKITHFQGIVLDITVRKATEEALKLSEKNYKDAYNKANFYKDLFTHDINNLLQIINSSAELITFQLGDSEKSKSIENLALMIKDEVKRGSKLVFNVRTLSELEEEKIPTQQVNICSYLKNSIDFVKKAYSGRNVNISAGNLDDNYYINANVLLQEVFENILINGIKYNENAVVDISVKISEQKLDQKTYIKIEFLDNGIGIIDKRKEVIFQRGKEAFNGSKGMGIGLSLVSKIIQIFNGKIWVEDRIEGDYTKGSNFIMLLPK